MDATVLLEKKRRSRSAAVSGFASRNPCTSLQPRARSHSSWPARSTPSAVTVTFRLLRQRQNRVRDRRSPGRTVDVAHERFVDLDAVRREARDVRERRIAGAEVVERDAATELPQSLQRALAPSRVLDEQRLRDLDLDQRSRHAGGRSFRFDDARGIAVQQLLAGAIDRHRNLDARDRATCAAAGRRRAPPKRSCRGSGRCPRRSRRSDSARYHRYSSSRQRSSASTPTSRCSREPELGLEHQVSRSF